MQFVLGKAFIIYRQHNKILQPSKRLAGAKRVSIAASCGAGGMKTRNSSLKKWEHLQHECRAER